MNLDKFFKIIFIFVELEWLEDENDVFEFIWCMYVKFINCWEFEYDLGRLIEIKFVFYNDVKEGNKKKCILLVEDNEINVEIVKIIL